MKKIITVFTLCAAMFVFVGCGATHYTVTKADGSTVATVGEPDYSKKTESYTFTNLDGQKVILQREDVKEIKQNKD